MPKAEASTGKPQTRQRLTVDIHTYQPCLFYEDQLNYKSLHLADTDRIAHRVHGLQLQSPALQNQQECDLSGPQHSREEQFPNSISFFRNAHIVVGINLVR